MNDSNDSDDKPAPAQDASLEEQQDEEQEQDEQQQEQDEQQSLPAKQARFAVDDTTPTNEKKKEKFARRPTLRRTDAGRPDHLESLMRKRRASVIFVDKVCEHEGLLEDEEEVEPSGSLHGILTPSAKRSLKKQAAILVEVDKISSEYRKHFTPAEGPLDRVEIRISNLSYKVKTDPNQNKIQTVYNQSFVYDVWKFTKRLLKIEPWPDQQSVEVLRDITLNFLPGKMYLVLGPPGSGKTSLLKAVAGRLSTVNGEEIDGTVLYNGLSLQDKSDMHVENVISFVGQLDFHAPRLTVQETFDFAFQCKSGGTHAQEEAVTTEATREYVARLDAENTLVNLIMKLLGLSHVADTFVGNSDVRGVSGGQRRRVTFGEMAQTAPLPILCGDEISTGLDAASTFEIINSLSYMSRISKSTRILSLLQPSPETVALFDEVILLGEGQILYAGPVAEVEEYFANLGYSAPDQMDVADFLQVLSTPDGAALYQPSEGSDRTTPYSTSELAQVFRDSLQFLRIEEMQNEPWDTEWEHGSTRALVPSVMTTKLKKKYANSAWRCIWLNLRRNLIIWSRDKRFLIANAIKNVIMGVSVGGVFYQTDNVVSIYGVLFQLNLFIMLGAMTSVPEQVNDRIIYYRHADNNFYGSFSYVFGQGVALIPQSLTDVLIFGTICYFMVGLETAAANYFIFIALLFVFSIVMNQQIGIFTATSPTKGGVQAASAVFLFFHLVFCGFIVPPTVIPNYYVWLYWWVPLSWSYRALLVNEFASPSYSDSTNNFSNRTDGEQALIQGGMIYNGEPVGREWIGYAFAYMVPYLLLCTLITGICLRFVRVEAHASPSPPEEPASPDEAAGAIEGEERDSTGAPDDELGVVHDNNDDADGAPDNRADAAAEGQEEAEDVPGKGISAIEDQDTVEIPFIPVTLSFSDICYDVRASKGRKTIRLLNNVYGIFEAGRMCALMGSSGAGKTTLMDVIALRKTSGTITGDVRLNGFEQEKISFRRCSGYVEQFDVQQPELTVRETVLFSARLRLNSEDPALEGDEVKQRIVDSVLRTLELTSLSECVIGVDGEGGLSFEQRKRVSIAVELAASPSIIFLDEPTSGLDARAAMLVVKTLRKIVDQGRTVVATIHQPSSAVFEMFDDLLLLKKGGHTVYAGELGDNSRKLVDYLESHGAGRINLGENPANWMLKSITDETDDIDYSEEFLSSPEYEALKARIKKEVDERDPDMEIKFDQKFAAPAADRRKYVIRRIRTVYWRSPAYNLLRMVISLVIAFILGSIFFPFSRGEIFTEQQATTVFNTIFISFIIVGVMTINSVLPVMLQIRNGFYRNRAAGMVDHRTLAVALGLAEQAFIIISSVLFCVVFLGTMGLTKSAGRGFAFWGFFCFNTGIYSYFGQAFVACVPTVPTAMILAAVFIGLNNFFSGLIVRPQYLSGFFEIPYWITPGHYVFEGMVTSQFSDMGTPVIATPGSDFFDALVLQGKCDPEDVGMECTGTIDDFLNVFFGGQFSHDHIARNAIILGAYLVLARLATFFGLKYFNYMNT